MGGVPPFTTQWNVENEAQSTLENLVAGEYAVNVVDAEGCAVEDVFTILEANPFAKCNIQLTNDIVIHLAREFVREGNREF